MWVQNKAVGGRALSVSPRQRKRRTLTLGIPQLAEIAARALVPRRLQSALTQKAHTPHKPCCSSSRRPCLGSGAQAARCPSAQKYLIQNQTGLRCYYYADAVRARSCHLHANAFWLCAVCCKPLGLGRRRDCSVCCLACAHARRHGSQTSSLRSAPHPRSPLNAGSAVQETSLHRRFCLESGDSETLRIQPVRRVIHLSTFSKVPPGARLPSDVLQRAHHDCHAGWVFDRACRLHSGRMKLWRHWSWPFLGIREPIV